MDGDWRVRGTATDRPQRTEQASNYELHCTVCTVYDVCAGTLGLLGGDARCFYHEPCARSLLAATTASARALCSLS